MQQTAHPVEFVEAFLKAASTPARPFGMGDRDSATNRKIHREPPTYSQPAPPAAATQPELVANQKAVPPPPVL
jgi:hypothetical protein